MYSPSGPSWFGRGEVVGFVTCCQRPQAAGDMKQRWYDDPETTSALPLRYRAYAAYSRLAGDRSSRRVLGGTFLLKAMRLVDRAARLNTIAPIHGIDGLLAKADLADERILDIIHEIRGENPEYQVMQSLLGKGDTFIDIGANVGTFSLLASRLVGEQGKVVAVEPQPQLADLIEESAALSSASNIRVVRAACTDAADAALLIPMNDTGRAGFFPGFSGKGTHERLPVSVITLDSIAESVPANGKVLVKIDVEGSELAVLRSGRSFLERRRPPLILEINPWSARAAGFSPQQLIDELVRLGYGRFGYVEDFPATVPPGAIALDRQSNIVVS